MENITLTDLDNMHRDALKAYNTAKHQGDGAEILMQSGALEVLDALINIAISRQDFYPDED